MESFIPHLPKDAVLEIMLWVPPESLVSLKLVSKSCHGFVSGLMADPTFVAEHLSRTKTGPSKSLVFTRSCPHLDHAGTECSGDTFSSVSIPIAIPNPDRDAIPALTEELDLPPPPRCNRVARWRVAGHCDGVVCLLQDRRRIVLCNPALRESRTLPESEAGPGFMALGFGYDERAKDHKLVRVVISSGTIRSEVYSLGEDSWRPIGIRAPRCESISEVTNRFGFYWGGVFYWLVKDFHGRSMVLHFDISDEEFGVIMFPRLSVSVGSVGLTVWNESVALFVFSGDCVSSLEIFVLDDKSGSFSWTKGMFVRPLVDIVNAFSFLCGDEFLIQGTDKRLFLYNVCTNKLRDVSVHDVDRLRNWDCFYVKSLVSVRRR